MLTVSCPGRKNLTSSAIEELLRFTATVVFADRRMDREDMLLTLEFTHHAAHLILRTFATQQNDLHVVDEGCRNHLNTNSKKESHRAYEQ